MKKRIVLFLGNLCIALLLSLFSCHKNTADNNGCSGGGTGIGGYIPAYRFWTKIVMYNTSIQLKDNSGAVIGTKVMVGYYPYPSTSTSEPTLCSYTSGNVEPVFSLSQGQHYSYTATNGTRTWTGTIDVPCMPNQCYNIEVK